jgi:hypothetical protein
VEVGRGVSGEENVAHALTRTASRLLSM